MKGRFTEHSDEEVQQEVGNAGVGLRSNSDRSVELDVMQKELVLKILRKDTIYGKKAEKCDGMILGKVL